MHKEEKIFRSVLHYLGYDRYIEPYSNELYKCDIYVRNIEYNKIIRTLMVNNVFFMVTDFSSTHIIEVYSYNFCQPI